MVFLVNADFSFALIISLFLLSVGSPKAEDSQSPRVFLTVSSLAKAPLFKDIEMRNVVINYYNINCERMQRTFPFIALYDHDPRENVKGHLFMFKPTDCPEGHILTNYSFPYIDFNRNDFVSKCLGYWVAYLEGGMIVHSNCIKTRPTWMYDMKKDIGHMTINCLMIPGTHDSGLYLKFSRFRDSIFEKYMYTQDETVFNQLMYGIRCLDLRIWHEGSRIWKSKIQITHDKIHFGLPYLQEILDDVKDFVTNTKEFVIIDFHRLLSGIIMSRTLSNWQHKEIIKILKEKFGRLIVDNEYADETLNTLWEMDKRVFITYRDELNSPEDNYVTYPVFHWWNSAETVSDLHRYLIECACSYRYYTTAAVAVLTPNMWTPLTDIFYSRRKKADEVNIKIDKWFRNELSCSSVVLTDYFLGNNIIETAIEANEKPNRCEIMGVFEDCFYYKLF